MLKEVFYPIIVVVLLSLGQLGFKEVGDNLSELSSISDLKKILVPLSTTLVLYGFATILWVYVLSYMELNRAFVFYALVFVMVPVLSHFFLNEPIDMVKVPIGTVLIISGVVVISNA